MEAGEPDIDFLEITFTQVSDTGTGPGTDGGPHVSVQTTVSNGGTRQALLAAC